jgi:hypothetical protein
MFMDMDQLFSQMKVLDINLIILHLTIFIGKNATITNQLEATLVV